MNDTREAQLEVEGMVGNVIEILEHAVISAAMSHQHTKCRKLLKLLELARELVLPAPTPTPRPIMHEPGA